MNATDKDGNSVVVVGGGQAGYQLAESLREEGFDGPIRIICGESQLPYQRPPLSKQLATESFGSDIAFATEDGLASQRIDVELGHQAVAIDRQARHVELDDGRKMKYRKLVLATGSRNRLLAGEHGTAALSLRDIADAQRLSEHLRCDPSLLIVGGGFLGLEVAALAASMGKEVDVVEAGRVLGRGVTTETAEWFLRLHRSSGVRVHERAPVLHMDTTTHGDARLVLADGRTLSAAFVLMSIGVVPNVELAVAAGLNVSNGIVTDEYLRTSDSSIYAIGDCAIFHDRRAGGWLRLESVQNALDQARHVAASMVNGDTRYDALPWFWSEQGHARLQIAGLSSGADDIVTLGNVDEGKFSKFCFSRGTLVAVESVNMPGDHMSARKCLSSGNVPARDLFDEVGFDFRKWVKESLIQISHPVLA